MSLFEISVKPVEPILFLIQFLGIINFRRVRTAASWSLIIFWVTSTHCEIMKYIIWTNFITIFDNCYYNITSFNTKRKLFFWVFEKRKLCKKKLASSSKLSCKQRVDRICRASDKKAEKNRSQRKEKVLKICRLEKYSLDLDRVLEKNAWKNRNSFDDKKKRKSLKVKWQSLTSFSVSLNYFPKFWWLFEQVIWHEHFKV